MDALLVARASETVDAAKAGAVKSSIPAGAPCPVVMQSYDFKWWRRRRWWDVHARIWVLYHFGGLDALLEGRACREGDGWVEVVACWRAIQTQQKIHGRVSIPLLIRFGITLHLWMDSFSHQGFRGWRHTENKNPKKRVRDCLIPEIGHAEYGSLPDDLDGEWTNQDGQRIVNRTRFMRMGSELWELLTDDAVDTECPPEFPGEWGCKRADGSLYQPSCLQNLERSANDGDLGTRSDALTHSRTGATVPPFEILKGQYWADLCRICHGGKG